MKAIAKILNVFVLILSAIGGLLIVPFFLLFLGVRTLYRMTRRKLDPDALVPDVYGVPVPSRPRPTTDTDIKPEDNAPGA